MHIFFDIDGTIIDHTQRIYDLYGTYAHTHGFSAFDKTVYLQKKREGASEKSIAAETFPSEYIEPYIIWKRSVIETPRILSMDTLVPGIDTVLTHIAEHHALIALSARQSKKQLIDQLERLDILEKFADIICVPNVADQPSRKNVELRKYLINHHIKTSDAAIVGDTEWDMDAAKQTSVRGIGVSWGMRSALFLASHGTYTVVGNPNELLRYLCSCSSPSL